MNKPLIVGVDGSDSSLRAIDWAAAEAARFDLPLRLVYGSMWERYEEGSADVHTKASDGHIAAEGIIGQAAERVGEIAPALKVSTSLGPAEP
ncbi:MAG TPA: universal stress protein, partial [Streptomyces sp.]